MLNLSSAQLPLKKRLSLLSRTTKNTESVVINQKTEVLDNLSPETKPKRRFSFSGFSGFSSLKKLKKWQLALIGVSLVLLIAMIALTTGTYMVAQNIKAQAQEVGVTASEAYNSFKAQNLPATQEQLILLTKQIDEIDEEYQKLRFYKYLPLARAYYLDGEHAFSALHAGTDATNKTLDAIVPYADILGFTGESSFEGGSAEDRLKVVLETLDKITPILDDISTDLSKVEEELATINSKRYPENLFGKPVRSYIAQAQDMSKTASLALVDYRPILEQLPSIAGGRGESKKYLILFQNDNELRPTGGFLTAYAIINIVDGKVEAERSDDIYDLDLKFNERISIPEKLGRYLTTEKYWHLRDMNISPDFEKSMDVFFEHYKDIRGEPGKEIDGIIAVDTEFLKNLLSVLGPVEVPGYGTFSSEITPKCDCPQIIYALSEIITKPTPYIREDRKGILGPLMRAILTKAYGAPKQQWPELLSTGWSSIEGRHVQFYFLDPELQKAVLSINATGKMTAPQSGEDFLGVVNANLGGAKSNLFIDYQLSQEISAPENGYITKSIEITYKNSRKADNCNLEAGLLCLNSTLKDWTRIYVPAGSKLVSAQGFTQEPEVYEENGFTVFDGFFILEPLSQAKLRLTYQVPYQDEKNYYLNIWKQGGVAQYQTTIDVTGGQEQLVVDKDVKYQAVF